MDNTEILKALEERQSELEAKIRGYEQAISELKGVKEAITALKSIRKIEESISNSVKLGLMDITPATYNKEATWADKIKYVLRVRGKSSVNEIIDHLVRIQPGLTRQSLLNTITVRCSSMAVNKEIGVEKTSSRNYYYLKE